MKNIFILGAVFLMCTPLLQAQTQVEEIDYYQSIFGSEKKLIVSSFIQPEGEMKDAFWTLYDEYEVRRKELGKNRIALLEKYAEQYENMSEDQIDETMTGFNKQLKASNKLVGTYYKKIRKATDAKTAAQFYHLEHFFLSVIRLSILDSIPVIGELDY
jgi:hypothetical protein